jgi:hypothetical protein
VDKLSAKHMEAYYHSYFDPLTKALGPPFGKSLQHDIMDGDWPLYLPNSLPFGPLVLLLRGAFEPTAGTDHYRTTGSIGLWPGAGSRRSRRHRPP